MKANGLQCPVEKKETLKRPFKFIMNLLAIAFNKKVAILSANKTLARQMNAECNELGIPSVLMEGRGVDIPSRDKRAYHRCTKIAVMNYWVYFNQNPVLDNADLLIMDDAMVT